MRSFFQGVLGVVILASAVDAGVVQFVVAEIPAERVHNDSFVISIDESDTAKLSHARALVEWIAAGAKPEESPGDTIVLADIRPGGDGINRNVLAPGQPAWSWQIEQPISFVGFTIEILDGWPTFVEEDVPGWMANTNGAIGFWGYTVVQELPSVPEPTAATLVGGLVPLALMRRAWQRRGDA